MGSGRKTEAALAGWRWVSRQLAASWRVLRPAPSAVALPRPTLARNLALAALALMVTIVGCFLALSAAGADCSAAEETTTTVTAAETKVVKRALGCDHAWPVDTAGAVDRIQGLRYVLFLVLVGCVLWTARRWRGQLHIANPEIAVSGPAGAGSSLASDPAQEEAVAQLKRALASLRLFSTPTVPGEPGPASVVTAVRSAEGGTPVQLLAAGMSLLAGRPYHVRCTAQAPDVGGHVGMLIEITDPLGRNPVAEVVRGHDWEAAARRAAHHVGAYVLPRAACARKPPWTPWHGVRLDADLFGHVLEAQRLVSEHRLEEALERFDQAIALDPLNPYIRLERALVLNELDLPADALAGYLDVIHLETGHDPWFRWKYVAPLLGEPATPEPPRMRRSPNGPEAMLIARYRAASTMANARVLAAQWTRYMDPGACSRQPRRHQEGRRVLVDLRPWLGAYAGALARTCELPVAGPLPTGPVEASRARLRRVLQFATLAMSRDLYDDYVKERPLPKGSLSVPLPASPLWAAVQYRHLEIDQCRPVHDFRGRQLTPDEDEVRSWFEQIAPGSDAKPVPLPELKGLETTGTGASPLWPPPPERVSEAVEAALGPPTKWRAEQQYMAACVFGLCLLDWRRTDDWIKACSPTSRDVAEALRRHAKLAGLAADALGGYVAASDSQAAAHEAFWLRRGDQDFRLLRSTVPYTKFLDRYLPAVPDDPSVDGHSPCTRAGSGPGGRVRERARPVPPNIAMLTMSEHFLQLVHGYVATRAALWTGHPAPDDELDAAAVAEELQWWELLMSFCRDSRDWPTRLDLIARVRDLRRRNLDRASSERWPYLFAATPRLARLPDTDDPQNAPPAWVDDVAEAARTQIRTAWQLKRTAETVMRGRDHLYETLYEALARRRATALRPWCADARMTPAELAARWCALRETFDATAQPEMPRVLGCPDPWEPLWESAAFSATSPQPTTMPRRSAAGAASDSALGSWRAVETAQVAPADAALP